MLHNNRISHVPFARLSAAERLEWIDFLTTTIADLACDVAADGDPDTVRTLLDINRMLTVMRDELATSGNPTSAEIVGNAQSLIRTMRTVSRERLISGTVH
jgi:hypothetical protein